MVTKREVTFLLESLDFASRVQELVAAPGEFPQTGVGSGWPYQADAAQTRVQHRRKGLVVVEDPACVGAACQRDHAVSASGVGAWGGGWLVTRFLPGSRSQADRGGEAQAKCLLGQLPQRLGKGQNTGPDRGAGFFALDSAEGPVHLHFRVLPPSQSLLSIAPPPPPG